MSKQSRKKSSKTSGPARSAAKAVAKSSKVKSGSAKSGSAKSAAKSGASSKTPAKAASKAAKPPVKTPVKKTSAAKPASESAPSPAGLAPGMKAPGFRLPRDGGGTASLADYAGQKLVLFFYPKANTPGCTKEAIDFTRLAPAFADSGTVVLGVSADSVKAQDNFRDKHALSVPLVSDERHEMLEAYGAWGEKSLYGRKFLGIIRSTVLIGRDGRIAKVWRNVKVDGHADAVLAAAKEL